MPSTQQDKQQTALVFAKRLDTAIKAMRLYPPEHVMCKDAVAAFQSCLIDLLTDEPQVVIAHYRRALHVNGSVIGNEFAGSGVLAQGMRMAGIQQITLGAGFRRSEIYELLGALCMDARELRAEGGLQSYLDIRGVEHITAGENRLTVVGTVMASELDSDPLAVLQAEAASLEDILTHPNMTDTARRQALIRFSAAKEHLAEVLNSMATRHHGKDSEIDDDQSAERITRIIPRACAVFAEELPDDRAFLNRNLAEALLGLPEKIRKKLIAKMIVATDLETAGAREALVAGLSNKQVAGVINDLASASSLTKSQTADIISKMPLELTRATKIAKLLGTTEADEPARVIKALSPTEAQDQVAKQRRPRLPSQPEAEHLAKLITPLCSDEQEEIKSLVKKGFDESLDEHTVMSLLTIVIKEDDAQTSERLGTTLLQYLYMFISKGMLASAATMIYACRTEIDKHSHSPESKALAICARVMREAASTEQITRLMTSAKSAPKLNLSRLKDYFQALGPFAANGLVDKLATEDDAGARKILCFLLRELGAPIVEELTAKLSDHRWYLVRNVVMVLGSIGTDKALLALRSVVKHPDARVRFEVATAIAQGRSSQAQTLLEVLLDDQDGRVRKNAASALLRVGAVEALRVALARPDLLQRYYRKKMDICHALAEQTESMPTDSAVLLQTLASIAHHRSLIFRRRQRALAGAALSALQGAQVISVV